MNRLEVRQLFRQDSPEVTDRVCSDTVLNSWIDLANREAGCAARCIVSNIPETFHSVEDLQYYDLESNIDNFYDIDDVPGGGVFYDDSPLTKTSPAEMNYKSSQWKSKDSGTPKKWWRRGKFLWFDYAPDTGDLDIEVDCVYIPSDLSTDASEIFNGLGHLQPYSEAISKFLQIKAKELLGKYNEATQAMQHYQKYVAWMKAQVAGYSQTAIYMRPK